jgi:regulatory protein
MRNSEPPTYEQALQYALRLLGQRPYSEAMLLQKLARRGTSPEYSTRIITKLTELGLLSDIHYAQSLIRTESQYKHASPRVITQKLRQKGIAPAHIQQVLSTTLADLPSEADQALYHAERYIKSHTRLSGLALKQKLMAFLYRKGFSSSAIQRAAKTLPAEPS